MRSSRKPQPILLLVSGCIALAIGAGLIFSQWNLLKKYPDKPESLALDQVSTWLNSPSQAGWITLSGGNWICVAIRTYNAGSSPNTDIVYRGDGSIIVLATFNGALTCADFLNRAATGVIGKMDANRLITEKKENPYLSSLPDSSLIVAMCGDCGPSNDQSGLLIGASIFVLGLLLMNGAFQDALKIKFKRAG